MFQVGQQYERRGLFKASALSYEAVFDQYYDSGVADDAIVGAMRMYLAYANVSIQASKAERLEKAVENYDRLRQIFPDSDLLKDAEAIYEQVQFEMSTATPSP